MKRKLAVLFALLAALALCCAAAGAEEALTAHLRAIADGSTDYVLATTEYLEMAPAEGYEPAFAKVLKDMKLTPAEGEAPDGEYVVLAFPGEGIRFDFFLADPLQNYIRQVNADGSEELFLAEGPEEYYGSVAYIMQAEADALAELLGLSSPVEAVLPDPGWVLDSVNGVVWQDERARLEVFLESTDTYKVLITWGNSFDSATEWVYAGSYDPAEQVIRAEYMYCDILEYDENGEEKSRTPQAEKECAAVFYLNEEGRVAIRDAADEMLEGKTFERLPALFDQVEGLHANIQHEDPSPAWVAALPAAQEADQLFIVAGLGLDKTTATVSMHEKGEDGSWHQLLSTPGYVGKNGLCADADHWEGSAQTPMGIYRFNKAFGIAPNPGCALDYTMVDESIYWSGDQHQAYNQMVNIYDYPDLDMTGSEHIVDYEYQYQYCLNISFNEEGTPGRGSAIFLHCLGPVKPYTGGCVAVPENIMKLIMQKVQEDCVVIIDTAENLGVTF